MQSEKTENHGSLRKKKKEKGGVSSTIKALSTGWAAGDRVRVDVLEMENPVSSVGTVAKAEATWCYVNVGDVGSRQSRDSTSLLIVPAPAMLPRVGRRIRWPRLRCCRPAYGGQFWAELFAAQWREQRQLLSYVMSLYEQLIPASGILRSEETRRAMTGSEFAELGRCFAAGCGHWSGRRRRRRRRAD